MTVFPQLELDQAKGITATIKTTKGDVELVLFDKLVPKTVRNFVELSKKGYYDGVIFHRVIPNFMIQGGDPTGTGAGGESIYGDNFEDEFVDELFNLRGALSMANAGPNTNSSQFFIVTMSDVPSNMISQLKSDGFPEEIIEAYSNHGGTPWLDNKHTVFGHVTAGQDIVDAIGNAKRDASDRPVEDIVINTIEISE